MGTAICFSSPVRHESGAHVQIIVAIALLPCCGCLKTSTSLRASDGARVELAWKDPERGFVVANGLIVLDAIPQGEGSAARLRVRNLGDSSIVVKVASCSCECVTVSHLPSRISPGDVEEVDLQIDLAREASFVGEMQVELVLSLTDASGREYEPLNVDIRFAVAPGNASQRLGDLHLSCVSSIAD